MINVILGFILKPVQHCKISSNSMEFSNSELFIVVITVITVHVIGSIFDYFDYILIESLYQRYKNDSRQLPVAV
jgi:hypothetical protein